MAKETIEGINIHTVDTMGNTMLVTTLENIHLIGLLESEGNQWTIASYKDMTTSFDGKYIAFSASQGLNRSLFIYDLESEEFIQTPIPGLATLVWSPNSQSILLFITEVLSDNYVYHLNENTLSSLGRGFSYKWLSDSSGFTFTDRAVSCSDYCPYVAYDLYIIDRFGNNERPLTDLVNEIGIDNPIIICGPTWSNPNRRLYYMVGCSGGGDNFHKYIYSVDLEGNNRQELDLDISLPNDAYIDIQNFYPEIYSNDVYLTISSQSYLNGIGVVDFSRLIKLKSPNNIEIMYEQKIQDRYLLGSAISLDRGLIAFSEQTYQGEGYLKVFDLNTNTEIREVMVNQSSICELNWLSDTQLMYSIVTNEYCYDVLASPSHIYEIYNVETDTVTQLPQSTGGTTWIIRPTYISSPIPLTVTESDSSTTVTESGITDTYTLALGTQPTADVVVSVTGTDQIMVSPVALTFTPENWDMPQTVTVSAVDDSVVEGDHTAVITHSAVSADAGYNGIVVADVTVTITDNDNAGVTITELDGDTAVVEDGATDTYTVALTSQPTADVVITSSVSSQAPRKPTLVLFLRQARSRWIVLQAVEQFCQLFWASMMASACSNLRTRRAFSASRRRISARLGLGCGSRGLLTSVPSWCALRQLATWV